MDVSCEMIAWAACEINLFNFFRTGFRSFTISKSLLRKGNAGEPHVSFRATHVNFGEMMCVSVVSGQ